MRLASSLTRAARLAAAAPLAAARRSKVTVAKENMSYMRRLFFGDIVEPQVFPFPCALSTDQKESLAELVTPVEKYFKEKVDSTKIDLEHQIPEETLEGLREMGLFGLQIPTDYGGLGFTNSEYARVVEELVMDGSIAVTLMAHQSIGLKGILIYGTDAQKAKYLPDLAAGKKVAAFCLTEPTAGSDAGSVRTRAVPTADGKHFVLNGGKMWISNGGIADVYTVFAQTPMPDGKDKMTAFIVERGFKGVKPGKPETKLGIRGSNTVELLFEDCHVPRENVLGEVGSGFKVAMNILNNGRFGLGAGTGGAMKKLLGLVSQYATTRTQFGRPLSEFGLIQEKFTDMAVRAYAVESMAYMTTALIDGPKLDCAVEAAICKIYGSESMWKSVNECIQILGGMGFMAGKGAPPYERFMRDTRILMIFEGTNEILRLFVALTGLQGPGEELKTLGPALKSPTGAIQEFPRLLEWARQRYGVGRVGPKNVLPSLRAEADELAVLSGHFADANRSLLMKYRGDILHQQLLLRRVADIAIDLFGMTAVLSRATSGKRFADTAQHEEKLAKLFCLQATQRVRANLAEIRAGRDRNGDELVRSIAGDVLGAGKYLAPHPLSS